MLDSRIAIATMRDSPAKVGATGKRPVQNQIHLLENSQVLRVVASRVGLELDSVRTPKAAGQMIIPKAAEIVAATAPATAPMRGAVVVARTAVDEADVAPLAAVVRVGTK